MRTVKSCILGASPSVPVESGQCTRVCIYMFGNIKERCRCARAGAALLPVVHNPQSSQTGAHSLPSLPLSAPPPGMCAALYRIVGLYILYRRALLFVRGRPAPAATFRTATGAARGAIDVSLVRKWLCSWGGIRAPGEGSWGPLSSVSSVSQSEPLTSGVSCQCVRVRVRCVQKATSLFI